MLVLNWCYKITLRLKGAYVTKYIEWENKSVTTLDSITEQNMSIDNHFLKWMYKQHCQSHFYDRGKTEICFLS